MEPFRILCCADDPMSWGDVEQTRKLYEEMLELLYIKYKRLQPKLPIGIWECSLFYVIARFFIT